MENSRAKANEVRSDKENVKKSANFEKDEMAIEKEVIEQRKKETEIKEER